MKKILTLVMLAMTGLVLIGCSQAQKTKSTDQIQVVASLDFYAEPARAILGKSGKVSSLINSASVDPHDYQATTTDAKQVANADVVIMNGAGYDSWLDKLVQANDQRPQLVNVAQDIAHLPAGGNEHLWYDFTVMPKLTRRLVKLFSKEKPQQRAVFQKNGQRYLAKLKKLQKQQDRLRQELQGQPVMITEPVFNYVLSSLGMRIVNPDFAQAIENGADPKPADLQKMQRQLDHRQVRFLVVNAQVSNPVIADLAKRAKQHHVPVLKVTETLPAKDNYVSWMTTQLADLQDVVDNSQRIGEK